MYLDVPTRVEMPGYDNQLVPVHVHALCLVCFTHLSCVVNDLINLERAWQRRSVH